MILVVIASATINGVVFGVVNNFGVFYAHLTELSKTDITALGFSNDNSQENEYHMMTSNNVSIVANNMTTTTKLDAVVQSLIGMFLLSFFIFLPKAYYLIICLNWQNKFLKQMMTK